MLHSRYVYLDHISSRLKKSEPDSQDSVDMEADDIFLDTKLRLKLKMADSCREQNNYTLTLRILKETHSVSQFCSIVLSIYVRKHSKHLPALAFAITICCVKLGKPHLPSRSAIQFSVFLSFQSCKCANDERMLCDWTHLCASTHHRKT